MRKALLLSLCGAAVYLAGWLSVALPYRLFPTDDDYFRSVVTAPTLKSFCHIAGASHHPVQLCSLYAVKKAWGLVSGDDYSALLVHAALSNAGTLFLLGLAAFLVTRSLASSLVAMLLFGTSAWPANYYFFYSYSPFATFLAFGCFTAILAAFRFPTKTAGLIGIAGICCAMYFWSSPAAAVMMVFFCGMLIGLWQGTRGEGRKLLKRFFRFFLIGAAPFSVLSFFNLVPHILENIHQQGISAAEIVKPVFFSFFRMLWVYNNVLLAAFLLALLLVALNLVKRKGDRLLLMIAAVVVLHPLAIDILPSTKLARTHFVVYPILILFVTISVRALMPGDKRRRFLFVAAVACIAVVIVGLNLQFASRIIHVRSEVPRFLKTKLPASEVLVLEEDSHADFLQAWLADFPVSKIPAAALSAEMFVDGSRALLLGPGGEGSGLSILSNCCLDDFSFSQSRLPQGLSSMTLPYYAYFPSFLLEEESCSALFLRGRIPDSRLPEKSIRIYFKERS